MDLMNDLMHWFRAAVPPDIIPAGRWGLAACTFCPADAIGWVYVAATIDHVAVVDGLPACSSHLAAQPLSREEAG